MKRTPLRSRIAWSLLGYTLLVGAGVLLVGYAIHEKLENVVWESLLRTELKYVLELHHERGSMPLPNSGSLRAIVAPDSNDSTVPVELRRLPVGVHDEIVIGDSTFVVLIERIAADWLYLLVNINEFEAAERALIGGVILIAVLLALVLTATSWWLAGRLLRPVKKLENDIADLATQTGSSRVEVDGSVNLELANIGEAVNALMQRVEESQQREREFLSMASHELRTPLAIITGASEVIASRPIGPALARPVERIRRAAQSVERLIPLLQMLAQSPSPDRAETESLLLLTLVQQVCGELAQVAEDRVLGIHIGPAAPVCVEVHRATLHLVLTHLLLSMCERSDAGGVRIELSPQAELAIFDPGQGLSAEAVGERFAARVRAGHSSAALSLPMLERLCRYWGWRLRWSECEGAMTVALDLRSAIAR